MSEALFYGYRTESFIFEGRDAILVYPEVPNKNRDWVLKTEYWGAFPEMEIELLKLGFHVAFLRNVSRFAPPEDCDRKAHFAAFLHKEKGLSEKCSLIGMSCGGAHAVNFAGSYPALVKCMYIDAPVLSFLSYPGKLGNAVQEAIWQDEFLKSYPDMTRAKLLSFPHHPMNKIDVLKAHRLPILMLYGTEDMTVTYEENGGILALEYEGNDCLTVVPRVFQGHHPHGSGTYTKTVVDFIIKHSED